MRGWHTHLLSHENVYVFNALYHLHYFFPSSHCYHRRQCPAIHRCRYLHRKVKVRNHGCLFHRKKNINTSHMLNFKFSLNLFEFILNFFKITLTSNYFNKLFFLYFFSKEFKKWLWELEDPVSAQDPTVLRRTEPKLRVKRRAQPRRTQIEIHQSGAMPSLLYELLISSLYISLLWFCHTVLTA